MGSQNGVRGTLAVMGVVMGVVAGCEGTSDPRAGDAETWVSPLLGSDVSSRATSVLRNTFVPSQKFRPHSVTMDGRLGLVWNDPLHPDDPDQPTTLTFVALADPTVDQNLWFEQAEGTRTIDLPVLEIPRTQSFTHGSATIEPNATLAPWAPEGSSALILDPRLSPSGKPVPVADPAACAILTPANRDAYVDPRSRYECYRIIHLAPFYAQVGGKHVWPLYQAAFAVVVDARAPTTGVAVSDRDRNPRIVSAAYQGLSDSNGRLRMGYQIATKNDVAAPGPNLSIVNALEMSATADGRLLFAASGMFTFNETPWRPNNWNEQAGLQRLAGWVQNDTFGLRSICRHIDPVSGEPACSGRPWLEDQFARVYPIAAQPLHYADGPTWPNSGCDYTWISPEGTDVICRPRPEAADGLVLYEGSENGPAMQYFAAGQHSGWMWRRLDGSVNGRQFNPDQLPDVCAQPPCENVTNDRPFSLMMVNTATGFWAQNRGAAAVSLPLLRQWPLFGLTMRDNALFNRFDKLAEYGLLPPALVARGKGSTAADSGRRRYVEVSFSCAVNPKCLLHLPMNELRYDAIASTSPRPTTQDMSNNFAVATAAGDGLATWDPYLGHLQNGAAFNGDYYGWRADEKYLSGFRGTGIMLPAASSVAVLATTSDTASCTRGKGCLAFQTYADGFTAEIAVQWLARMSNSVLLAVHHGLWSMAVNPAGDLTAQVSYSRSDGSRSTLSLTAPNVIPIGSRNDSLDVQAEAWRHVALRVSLEDQDRTATLYVNGYPAASSPLPTGSVLLKGGVGSRGDVIRIGADCPACASVHLMMVDEVRFHSAPLLPEEIRAAAGSYTGRIDFLSPEDARTVLASYFRFENPRKLTLDSGRFPVFVRPEDLRIPAAFQAYAAPSVAVRPDFFNLVKAGQTLFGSSVLSTNSAGMSQVQLGSNIPMSCAVCHQPGRNFTDGRVKARGVKELTLNTPTIVNRAYGTNQFFATRAQDLMALAFKPIVNPNELNADRTAVMARINTGTDGPATAARTALRSAFGAVPFQESHVQLALTAYELTLLSADPFSETLMSAGVPLSDGVGTLDPHVVLLGKELFEGKARCTACHTGPNLSDELRHNTGVEIDAQKSFKTPTLWNIAATGPYFHDGRASSLGQVLDFYNRGGNGLVSAANRAVLRTIDPELRPLGLSEAELVRLEAYLRSLKDAGPAISSAIPTINFSEHGRIPGLVCVPVNPGASAWSDNYLCSVSDLGLVFSAAGSISGMKCVQITEPLGAASLWSNAYVCLPASSPVTLAWSYDGPISDAHCTHFMESPEDVGWADNYLCW
jgi:cytochrome c peroxidase